MPTMLKQSISRVNLVQANENCTFKYGVVHYSDYYWGAKFPKKGQPKQRRRKNVEQAWTNALLVARSKAACHQIRLTTVTSWNHDLKQSMKIDNVEKMSNCHFVKNHKRFGLSPSSVKSLWFFTRWHWHFSSLSVFNNFFFWTLISIWVSHINQGEQLLSFLFIL